MKQLKSAFAVVVLAAIVWIGWRAVDIPPGESSVTSAQEALRRSAEGGLERAKKGDREASMIASSHDAKGGDGVTSARQAPDSSQTTTSPNSTIRLAGAAQAPLPASSKELLAEFLEHGQIPGVPSRIHELHAAFDAEPVDPSWANAAQAQLRLYIDGATENAAAWLDVSSVACHQTLCEVQVVGNFPGQINPGDPMDWMAYAHRMEAEQWFRDRYDFPVDAVTRVPDGRVIYLTYFSRRPQLKSERLATR